MFFIVIFYYKYLQHQKTYIDSIDNELFSTKYYWFLGINK